MNIKIVERLSLLHCSGNMSAIASHITCVPIIGSSICSGAHPRKYQSSVSLAFVRGISRWQVAPLTWDEKCGKCFHLITSSLGNLCALFAAYFYANRTLSICTCMKLPRSVTVLQLIYSSCRTLCITYIWPLKNSSYRQHSLLRDRKGV